MKKGQMEIMGLLIVVILMILGMLFVVRFVILKPGDTIKQSYADTVLAANLKNSILLFSTHCHNKRIQDLLADCVSGGVLECNSGFRKINSCAYATEKIDEIFAKTVVRWRREYQFEACLFRNGRCDATNLVRIPAGAAYNEVCQQERESKFSPIQTEKGIMKVTLNICRDVS
jgi:hypothetical protein